MIYSEKKKLTAHGKRFGRYVVVRRTWQRRDGRSIPRARSGPGPESRAESHRDRSKPRTGHAGKNNLRVFLRSASAPARLTIRQLLPCMIPEQHQRASVDCLPICGGRNPGKAPRATGNFRINGAWPCSGHRFRPLSMPTAEDRAP